MKDLLQARDISMIELEDEKMLVIACDSAGGIGPKKEMLLKFLVRLLGDLLLGWL